MRMTDARTANGRNISKIKGVNQWIKKLIKEFCLRFYGYGNLNSDFWFTGMGKDDAIKGLNFNAILT